MKKIRLLGTVVIVLLFSLMALGSMDQKEEKKSDTKDIVKTDSSQTDTDKSDKGNKEDESGASVTEKAKEKNKDNLTVKIEETVVYDKNDIKITAKEYSTDSILGDGIKFLIENNTDKNIRVSTNATIVNDYMILDYFSESVAAGKKANETLSLSSSELKAAGISVIGKIEVYFHITDTDTHTTLDDSDCVLIKTNNYDIMDTTVDESGTVLYDEDGIKIVGKYVDESSFWGASVMLYCENNSGKNISIYVDDVSVNGFMLSALFSKTVYDGKKAYEDITLFSSDLEENDITSVDEIALKFRIRDADTRKTIVETDEISFSTK